MSDKSEENKKMFVNLYSSASEVKQQQNIVKTDTTVTTAPVGRKRLTLGESIGAKKAVVPPKAAPANTKEAEIARINSFSSDKDRIIEYNKKHARGNYIIVDKKDCSATVYDKNGKAIKKFEVGLGMDVGDKKAGGYNCGIASKIRKYTAPGEYTLGEQSAASDTKYGSNLFIMEGDGVAKDSVDEQVAAIHQIPTQRLAQRKGLFKNGTISDNRMSFGCINMLSDDFDEMEKIIQGTGTKLYVLPEEKGNKLQLEMQVDGSLKFVQTKYRNE